MKPLIKFALSLAFSATLSLSLQAVPARKGVFTLSQPDGTTIRALLKGDEFASVLTDESGHAIAKNENGWYCYAWYSSDGAKHCGDVIVGGADIDGTKSRSLQIPYGSIRERGLEKRRAVSRLRSASLRALTKSSPASAEPVKKNCIILLANFSDVKMRYGRDYFQQLINGKSYSYNGASGSVSEYFADQFHGQYEFNFEVGPLVTLSGSQKDYGAHSGDDNDKDPAGLVREACQKAAEQGVDFSRFDDDGDGEVDNVFVFVAGKDEAEGGGDDCIWSHQWYLFDGAGISLVLNGKRINNYAISTELGINSIGNFVFTSIGTFCHEYTHVLGQLDMYDTDYEGSGGEADCLWGTTSLMDGGSYNNSGNTPPNFDAIDLDIIGVGNPETLSPGEYTLEPVNENGRYLKYESSVPGEYYLIECRGNSGWDKYIGARGLAIYHIDMSKRDAGYSDSESRDLTAEERWYANEVNCRPDYQCADIIEALSSAGAVSQVFFPYRDIDAFTSKTDPAFVFRDGTESPLAITRIRIDGDNVKFSVTNTNEIVIPKVVSMDSEIFQNEAILSWEADDPEYAGKAYVDWGGSDDVLTQVEVEPWDEVKYGIRLEGLSPRTAYKVKVRFGAGGVYGSEEQMNFTTKSRYSGYPFIWIDEAGRNDDGSFQSGAAIPLVVYNRDQDSETRWYFDGKEITPDGSGFYHLTRSGTMRAVTTSSDGSIDIIEKKITIK